MKIFLMQKSKWIVLVSIFVICISLFTKCTYRNEQDILLNAVCDTTNRSFSQKINPLMVNHCNSCHSGTSPSAGISTEGYANVKTLALNGMLLGTIKHSSGYKAMPQGASKLSDCNIELIQLWIADGTPNN